MFIIEYLTQHGAEIIEALLQLIGGFSVIANLTPTDKDNKALSFIAKGVNFLATNFKVKNVKDI